MCSICVRNGVVKKKMQTNFKSHLVTPTRFKSLGSRPRATWAFTNFATLSGVLACSINRASMASTAMPTRGISCWKSFRTSYDEEENLRQGNKNVKTCRECAAQRTAKIPLLFSWEMASSKADISEASSSGAPSRSSVASTSSGSVPSPQLTLPVLSNAAEKKSRWEEAETNVTCCILKCFCIISNNTEDKHLLGIQILDDYFQLLQYFKGVQAWHTEAPPKIRFALTTNGYVQ